MALTLLSGSALPLVAQSEQSIRNIANYRRAVSAPSSRHRRTHSGKAPGGTSPTQAGDLVMFSKTAIALAIFVATASGAFAAVKHQSAAPRQDVYDTRGGYIGADPDANVRFELRRDEGRGQN
jgi:hypothetical protein